MPTTEQETEPFPDDLILSPRAKLQAYYCDTRIKWQVIGHGS